MYFFHNRSEGKRSNLRKTLIPLRTEYCTILLKQKIFITLDLRKKDE